MRFGIGLATLLGLFGSALLVLWYGLDQVGEAFLLAGGSGLAAICLYQLLPMALCALAWRALLEQPQAGRLAYIWCRMLRDAGSDLLPLIPGTGELLGIRVMKRHGVEPSQAMASTVVDITVEMCAQVAFTLLGLAILLVEQPDQPLISWSLIGIAATLPIVCGLVFAQRFGFFSLLERFADRLAGDHGWTLLERASGLHEAIHRLYRDRRRIAAALAIHFVAWIVGVGEAGIALYMMGAPLGFGSLIVLESLSHALRSAAFFVPAAAGVQEGGYVLLGGALGIGPDFALALSLLKRSRGLVLGGVAFALWHGLEWCRLLHHSIGASRPAVAVQSDNVPR
jgi:putative membrane protein